jgi:hypothetical protein
MADWIVQSLNRALGIGYPILYNAIGVLSIFLQFMIFQMAHKKRIVFVGLFSDIGWLSYFTLQGDLISGTANIIGIMSKIVILLRERYRWAGSKAWNIFFVAFAAAFSVCTFRVWMDVFAVLACVLSILAYFMKDENGIRKVALLAYCAFMCNSISKLYVVALIADVTAFASCIIALIRYKKETKTPKEDTDKHVEETENKAC